MKGGTKKKATTFKVILDKPFEIKWPHLESEYNDLIVSKLMSAFKEVVPDIKPVKKQQGKRNNKDKVKKPPRNSENTSGLCFGLNHITKTLEKENGDDDLVLVIVCKKLGHKRIIQHLPILTKLKNIPLCPLALNSSQLGDVFGLKSLLAFGFKKSSQASHKELIELILANTPDFEIDWLTDHPKMHTMVHHVNKGKRPRTVI